MEEIICPATGNKLDIEYCGGDCINCPWMTVKVEPEFAESLLEKWLV